MNVPIPRRQFFAFNLILLNYNKSVKFQEYHDFIELATESVSEITKEVNGSTVPVFTREEVDEIVIAQVIYANKFTSIIKLLLNNMFIQQASIFLLAGFDTTASTLTHACYMLAKHPDVQEKLYHEVLKKIEKHVS